MMVLLGRLSYISVCSFPEFLMYNATHFWPAKFVQRSQTLTLWRCSYNQFFIFVLPPLRSLSVCLNLAILIKIHLDVDMFGLSCLRLPCASCSWISGMVSCITGIFLWLGVKLSVTISSDTFQFPYLFWNPFYKKLSCFTLSHGLIYTVFFIFWIVFLFTVLIRYFPLLYLSGHFFVLLHYLVC